MPPRRTDAPAEPNGGEPGPEKTSELLGFGGEEDDEDASVVALRTDSYEDSNIKMDPRRRMPSPESEIAPEVNPGAWRERAFAPRGTMPRKLVLAGLERAIQTLEVQRLGIPVMREDLLMQWQPFLRQAVEQAGGDGIDSHLLRILKPPGRPARDKFVGELGSAVKRLQQASVREAFFVEARKISKLVEATLGSQGARRVSLRVLENELDGRLDIGVVLPILFATPEKLRSKLEQVDASAESLRTMLRSMPGQHPDGMMWNYARLKVERQVIAAELEARS